MTPFALSRLIDQCYCKPTFRALLAVPDYQRVRRTLDDIEIVFQHRKVTSARINRAQDIVEFSNGSKIYVIALSGPKVYERICSYAFDDANVEDLQYDVRLAVEARIRPRDEAYFNEARFRNNKYFGGPNLYTKEQKTMNSNEIDKDVLKRNKFYVGSPKALTSNWGKPNLADATKHAEERLEATGEPQFIVKIVRVVRRKKPPVVIEDVR